MKRRHVMMFFVVAVSMSLGYYILTKESFENSWEPIANNPEGSYLQSCDTVNSQMDKGMNVMKVTAKCWNTRGQKKDTELYIGTGNKPCPIGNIDGNLRC
jgi:hypothetical protein